MARLTFAQADALAAFLRKLSAETAGEFSLNGAARVASNDLGFPVSDWNVRHIATSLDLYKPKAERDSFVPDLFTREVAAQVATLQNSLNHVERLLHTVSAQLTVAAKIEARRQAADKLPSPSDVEQWLHKLQGADT